MSSVTLALRMKRVMLVLAAMLVEMGAFSAAPAMAAQPVIPPPVQPVIPPPVQPIIPPPAQPVIPPPVQPDITHVVQPGETLSEIAANRFGIHHDVLAAENGLPNPHLIFPGQVLRHPSNAPLVPANDLIHVVQPGETLSEIAANRFGIHHDVLAAENGLPNPHLIFPGQVLRHRGF